ncbi:MAG: hypothetical protein H0T96_05595 [Thermoleophilaceae bacterium]|nr:hypothetical protein [Thermoleophilaceae bacterium]
MRAGRVDLAFRRWDRPRLLVGTRMRTAIGLVEATAVDVIAVEAISDAEARRAGAASREELLAGLARHPQSPVFRVGLRFAGPDPRIAMREQADLSDEEHARLVVRLDRLNRASRHGPWTRAAELALELGREMMAFKRDVRKLKELGLTESLDTGYRLSPRARALRRRA